MTNRWRLTLIGLNLILLVTGVFLLGPTTDTAVALSLDFRVGDIHRYEMSVRTEAQHSASGGEPRTVVTDLHQTVRWEVTAVEEGSATLSVKIEQMDLKVDGQQVNPGDLSTERSVKIRPNGLVLDTGEVIDLGPWMTSSGAFPALDQMVPILPEGKVRPGDSWVISEDIPMPDGGDLRIQANNKLKSLTERNGATIAEVVSDVEMPVRMAISFGDLLSDLPGAPAENAQVPRLIMEGSARYQMTGMQHVQSRTLLSTSGSGEYDITLTFEGIDGMGSVPPPGSFTGKIDFEMKRLES